MAQIIPLKGLLQNKWAYVGLGGAVIAAIGGYAWWQMMAAKVSPLHVYYPERTTFFVEVEPGEAIAKKMLRWLDAQSNVQKNADKQAVSKSGQPVAKPEANLKQEPFRQALIDKFDTTFKPQFSMGLWSALDKASQTTPPQNRAKKIERLSNGHALVILPLKQPLDFAAIVKRFNGDLSAFEMHTQGKTPYFIEQNADGKNTFAVIDQKLFMANNPAVIVDLIQHLNVKQTARTDKNVFEHPTNKRYLSLLDINRNGTMIINNTAYAQQLKQVSRMVPSTIPSAIQNRVLLYADVTPLTMGALKIKDGRQLEADFYMPLNLKALHNEKLSAEIKGLYQEKKPLAGGQYLPQTTTFLLDAQSLDRWYDLYQHHLMPKEQLAQLQQMAVLLSLVQLNWRNDIVGLLSGETVFASFNANPIPVFLLEGTKSKLDSYNRVLDLVVSGKFFPVRHDEVQIGNVAVHSFEIPKQHERVSVGTLEKSGKEKMVTFAQASDFEQLVNVKDKKLPTLADDPAYKSLVGAFPKNLALFLYSDVDANQRVFQRTLKEARLTATSKSTIALAEHLQAESKHTVTNEISKLAAAVWAEPKGGAEDLVQAKVVVQLK